MPPALTAFDGTVWRLVPASTVDNPTAPARAPEGRFHHDGQIAVYASLTAEGAEVAMKRYGDDGVGRQLIALQLTADQVIDERGNADASIVWQDIRAAGEPSPTWDISDAARNAGAQAMLYSSRSRPDLTHVVVFQPTRLKAKP